MTPQPSVPTTQPAVPPAANTNNNVESQDIAVIGMGLRFPGGSNTPGQFWQNMIDKFDGITRTPKERWSQSYYDQDYIANEYGGFLAEEEWKRFDPLFFGVSPKEATFLDPQQRLLMTILWEALEDAHIKPAALRGSDTGVFIGLMNLDYQKQLFRDVTDMTPYGVTGNGNSFISNRLSFAFDFRGPSMTLDTACSSSLNAVYLGCQAIATGDCEMAVVGGVNALYDPTISVAFSDFGMLSHKGKCRSFDADGDGFVRSEGAGLVVLKKLDAAVRDNDRIYCVIKGGSSNVDGYNNKTTITAPSRHAQSENIELALKRSNLEAGDISYIESHGTGTPVGDPIEVEALAKVFTASHSPEDPLLIGSVKSNMGHLESAAGIASVIKACLMLKHRSTVPNIHFNRANPKIFFDDWNIKVVTETKPFPTDKVMRVGVNSFGLSGSNCHIILEEVKPTLAIEAAPIATKQYLVPVSANSKLSLDHYLSAIAKDVDRFANDISFTDFVAHQIHGRERLPAAKKVIVASNWQEFIEQKNVHGNNSTLTSNIASLSLKESPPVVFVFCGQGPQWKAMGKTLYATEPVYKAAVDRCDKLLTALFGYSILAQLEELASDASPEIHEPKLAQPSVFLIQVGLVALYTHWNIKPTIVVGHSFGEVTAALCANILTLETAAKIVYHRSTLQNLTIGSGKMMSIGIGADQYIKDYATAYPAIEIACFNSSDSIVITGSEAQLKEINVALKEGGVFTAFLTTPCSFHSSSQEVIRSKVFESPLATIDYAEGPLLPFFSTIHGNQLLSKSEYNTQYIYDNLREPVAFTKAIENIFGYISANQLGTSPIFVEIAPHPTLAFYIKKCVPTPAPDAAPFTPLVISPLHKKKDDTEVMQQAIASLYCAGVPVDFGCQLPATATTQWKETTINLPRYQWDTEVYWDENMASQKIRLEGPSRTILGNRVNTGGLVHETVINVNMNSFQFLKGHKIKGKYLFPGSGYIDNIVTLFAGHDVAIHNLEFNMPFFLTEGVQHHLQTSAIANSKNEYKMEFHFKDNNNSDKWIRSAHGRVSTFAQAPATAAPRIDLDALRAKCSLATLNKREVYTKLQTLGLPYGPTFQRIESFQFGVDCSLSTLELNPAASQYDVGTFFNASILDCCLHGLLALMDGPQEIVFERLENFKLFTAALPATRPERVYLFSKVIKQAGNTSQGSVDMITEDGVLIASFGKIVSNSLIKVKRTTTIKHPSANLYTHVWQSKDAPLTTPVIAGSVSECVDFETCPDFKALQATQIVASVFSGDASLLTNQVEAARTSLNIDERHTTLFARLFTIATGSYNPAVNAETLTANLVAKYPTVANEIASSSRAITEVIPSLFWSADAASAGAELARQDAAGCTQLDNVLYNSVASGKALASLASHVTAAVSGVSNTKRVFKILDLGATMDASRIHTSKLINLINSSLPATSPCVVEYTVICPTPELKTLLKTRLPASLNSALTIRFRTTISLDLCFVEQGLLASNYDLVASHYAFSSTGGGMNVATTLSHVIKVLSPSGHIALVESPASSTVFDVLAVGGPAVRLEATEYSGLFRAAGLTFTAAPVAAYEPLFAVAQKSSTATCQPSSYSTIVFVVSGPTSASREAEDAFIAQGLLHSTRIETLTSASILADQTNLLSLVSDGQNNAVVFLAGLEPLNVSDYRVRTMEFVKLNQALLKTNNTTTSIILTTTNAQADGVNFLGTSLVGIYRYFLEFQGVLATSAVDIDTASLATPLASILALSNTRSLGDKEFIIRNNQVQVQRIHATPSALQSDSSYERDPSGLTCRLNSNLSFVFQPKDVLAPEQVEIQVKATGINYKDNLFYRGLLPQEIFSKGDIYNPPFGLECSGIISRVGSAVTRFKIGDAVVGFASHSFSSHVATHQDRIVHKPDNISFVDAAAIPVVYATAYYAIFHVGRFLPSKDSILVHSSTGGVGIAALNLLKYKQHAGPVFATIGGSKEKEQYLRDTYGSLITGIFSTASNGVAGSYADLIRTFEQTNQGVDMILNTLSGDFLKPNFDSLSPVGRIMDLSVTQLMENDNIDIEVFKYHVGYQTIDLERAIAFSPKIINGILTEVFAAVAEGKLAPIPVACFPVRDTKKAIEYINERKHIGKIVVDFDKFDEDVLAPLASELAITSSPIVRANYTVDGLTDTLLVTGQTGIAVFILRWLLEHAPAALKHVIVLSRSALKWELQLLINQLKARQSHVTIHYRSVDVSNLTDLTTTVNKLYTEYPAMLPVKSLIHFATIYDYCPVDNVSQQTIDATHGPKAIGALNLHTLGEQLGWKLNHFVLFSSIVSVMGSTNQASYTSANFVLDGLAQHRRSLGLAATAINWGALDAGGEVAKDKSVAQFLQSQGVLLVSLAKILGGLNGVFTSSPTANAAQVMLANFSYRAMFEGCPQIRGKMEHLAADEDLERKASSQSSSAAGGSGVADRVIAQISELLSIHSSKLNMDTRLKDYGIDSLLTVQLKNWIDQEFQKNLFTHLQLSSNSINSIIAKITAKTPVVAAATATPVAAAATTKAVATPVAAPVKTVDFWKSEATLDEDITLRPDLQQPLAFSAQDPASVFLTGATGRLGARVLADLLVRPSINRIFCLVRGRDSVQEAKSAIRNQLAALSLEVDVSEFDSRVFPVLGNLSATRFGLPPQVFDQLGNAVDIIISCAANTTATTYEDASATNVKATCDLARLAVTGARLKRVAYVSSSSVLTNESGVPVFDNIASANTQTQSHMITELIAREASTRGIPTSIVRFGAKPFDATTVSSFTELAVNPATYTSIISVNNI
eukprot:gene11535-13463_t